MLQSLALIEAAGKWKKVMTIFIVIIAIHGTAGFAMFIAEEGMQAAMFGAFAYSNAEDWKGLEWHIRNVMKPVHGTSEWIIGLSCIPGALFCPAYLSYLNANRGYIRATEHRIKTELSQ